MGLHDLKSQGLSELFGEAEAGLSFATQKGWVTDLLARYSSLPEVPLGNPLTALDHAISAARQFVFGHTQKEYIRKADPLLAVIKMNEDHRLAAFIEIVDEPDMTKATEKYTVWKGTLFETVVKGQTIVCWHPDKDFTPAVATKIKRTGHSAKGRRQRRRDTATSA